MTAKGKVDRATAVARWVYVWTWCSPTIGLGRFASATKALLVADGKMTVDSIAVRCRLVPLRATPPTHPKPKPRTRKR